MDDIGLDNGVLLRVRHEIDFEELKREGKMPYFLEFEKMKYGVPEGYHEYEICYWRKWWGFRDCVVGEFGMPMNDGVKKLSIADVEKMRDLLIEWMEGKHGYDISTVWSFDELLDGMSWDVLRLSWLIQYMTDNAEKCIVEFYDSY